MSFAKTVWNDVGSTNVYGFDMSASDYSASSSGIGTIDFLGAIKSPSNPMSIPPAPEKSDSTLFF
jgi:hypothetical protein